MDDFHGGERILHPRTDCPECESKGQAVWGGWGICTPCGAMWSARPEDRTVRGLVSTILDIYEVGWPVRAVAWLRRVVVDEPIPGGADDLMPLLTHDSQDVREAAITLLPKITGEDNG